MQPPFGHGQSPQQQQQQQDEPRQQEQQLPQTRHQHPHLLPEAHRNFLLAPTHEQQSPSSSSSSSAATFAHHSESASSASPALAPLSASLAQHDHDRTLPPLSSITGHHTLQQRYPSDLAMPSATNPMPPPAAHILNPQQTSHHHQTTSMPLGQTSRSLAQQDRMGMDAASAMDMDTRSNSVVSIASTDGPLDSRSASVTLDDPDVRLAAEALGDLRADFVSSPPNRNVTLPTSPGAVILPGTRSQSPQAPEPLLSLLTTSHPLLATTIEGATSAYGGAKNYSPRFKSSAEYVEGYLTPIANTVGSVGRVTGVEGSVRWFLGAGRRQRSDVEAPGSSKKRRKVEDAPGHTNKRLEAESFPRSTETGNLHESFPPTPKDSRRMSFASTVDTLPPYDDMRSPAYTETTEPQTAGPSNSQANAAWQSRLIMSTSGLSVAMSEESLRSLKYCLKWLRWANEHIGGVVGNLKTTLAQYDQPGSEKSQQDQASEAMRDDAMESQTDEKDKAQEPTREELAQRINILRIDVLKTLQQAVNMVSRYAGGALPENARILVRRHLVALPQRFHIASMSESNTNGQPSNKDNDSAVRDGAQRVLVLAKEGLDMVSQVSGVLDGTIVSAEEWCERMGKKRRDSREALTDPVLPQVEPSADVKMG